jgi:ABC-type phosphate transport system substrate-binding protein
MKPMRILSAMCALALVVLPGHAPAQSDSFVLVVNVANPANSLEHEEVSRIFLKRSTKWPGGAAIAAVDLDKASAARMDFTKKVHGRSVGAIASYWQQRIFSGRETPPPERPTDAAVLEFVRANPHAIGYVSASTDPGAGVKILSITQ